MAQNINHNCHSMFLDITILKNVVAQRVKRGVVLGTVLQIIPVCVPVATDTLGSLCLKCVKEIGQRNDNC